MKRPLAVTGFAYTAALEAALILGTDYTAALAAFFVILLLASLFLKEIRKNTPIVLVSIISFIAVLMYSGYTFAFVEPVSNLYGQRARIEGRICDVPYEQNGRYYYKLETSRIEIPNVIQNTKILVSSKSPLDADFYDSVTAEVLIFSQSDSIYENGNIAKGIYARGSLNSYAEIEIRSCEDKPLYYYALKARQTVENSVYHLLPKKQAAFVAAVLIGDRSGLSETEKEMFRTAGISHIAAVSGFHITVIAQLLFFFLKFLMNKRKASLLSVIVIFSYMAAVGFSPSVFRAGVMQIIGMLAMVLFEEYDSLNSLGLSALIICWLNPYAAADIGFMLSFLSSLGIILLSDAIYGAIRKSVNIKNQWLSKIFLMIAANFTVSFSAVLFSFPVMILYFKQFALYTFLTNVLIGFAVTLLLSSAVLMVFFDVIKIFSFLCLPFRVICGVLANFILFVAEKISELPFSVITLSQEYVPVWLIVTGMSFLFFYVLDKKREILKTALPIALIVLMILQMIYKISEKDILKISVIDTGGGICVFLQNDHGKYLLSCGGEAGYYSELSRYLKESETEKIDLLLINGRDKESSVYAEKILKNYAVRSVQIYHEEELYERESTRLESVGEKVSLSADGEENILNIDDLQIKSMADSQNYFIYFELKNKQFLIVSGESDCVLLPEDWRKPDYLIYDSEIKNVFLISCDNRINVSEERKNIALKIHENGEIILRREKLWLS